MESNKILSIIFDKIQTEMPPTVKYTEIMTEFEDERKDFLNNLQEQNSETLEHLCDWLLSANEEQNRQYLYKGIAIATRFIMEAVSLSELKEII